jgi:hypothetical protein
LDLIKNQIRILNFQETPSDKYHITIAKYNEKNIFQDLAQIKKQIECSDQTFDLEIAEIHLACAGIYMDSRNPQEFIDKKPLGRTKD